MLRRSAIKRIIMSSLALVIMLLLCLFPKSDNLSIPEEVIYVDELTMPIYVMDQNNYVARTSVVKKETNDQIKYIIDTLTIGSINANYLPNGFTGIIPKNTKLIDYELKDKLLKLNFSKEILDISSDKEEKLIESLIYSLCELEGVAKIMIFIEGESLTKLPKSEKSLPLILDKSYGINKIYNFDNIKDTSKTTVYYIGKYNDNLYYIPITKVTNDKVEPVEVIVNELKSTPIYETNLISYLNASYELEDYEILENSITLSFNNQLLANLHDSDINEKVRYTLSLSLRDTYDIDNIVINLD
ncbi:MAG: GerMN domain-containing protein [Bacilli bacterium]|nr:GerMN domain-containing protein [Bacilli bacterium]